MFLTPTQATKKTRAQTVEDVFMMQIELSRLEKISPFWSFVIEAARNGKSLNAIIRILESCSFKDEYGNYSFDLTRFKPLDGEGPAL